MKFAMTTMSDTERSQKEEALAKLGWRLLMGPAFFTMCGNLLGVNLWASAAVGTVVSVGIVVLCKKLFS